jgi:hypothetical protein
VRDDTNINPNERKPTRKIRIKTFGGASYAN